MRVVLKRGREHAILGGHPWLYSGAIASRDGEAVPGMLVEVVSAEGRLLGRGTWSPQSIAVRMLTLGPEPVDAALVQRRIASALALRSLLRDTDALRLVNGEGDRLPGVVVDRYADFLVCQFLTAGAERLKPMVLEALEERVRPRGVFERSEGSVRQAEGLDRGIGVLAGEEPPPEVVVAESGRRYLVDVRTGQKTGFFLDQRPNRDLVRSLAAGRRVLDLFAHTGGFAIAAAQGGARHVLSVESSVPALTRAEAAWRLNALPPDAATFTRGDVFAYLRGEVPPAELVVLDPPPFARRRADRDRALAGYKEINRQALRHCAPDALVLTFSCSQHVGEDDLATAIVAAATDARRACQILQRLGPGLDHPQALGHAEGRYLKGFLLRVE